MILYIIAENGYYGGSYEVPDDPDDVGGIPLGTTKKPIPEAPEGMYVIWGGSGWNLTNIPPYVPPPVEDTPPVTE